MNKIAIAAMGLTAAFAFSLAACAEMHYAQPISEPAASQGGCRYSLYVSSGISEEELVQAVAMVN